MTKPEPNPFAMLVRRGMERKSITLRGLCRTVSIDPSFFSKVLSGKRSPPSEEKVLRRIASALELSPIEVVVAAGRIPFEWSAISRDRGLLDSVHGLLSPAARPGGKPEPPAERPVRKPGFQKAIERKNDFAEELL